MQTDAAFAETERARLTFGRGDGATHAGAPDRGEAGWRPGPRNLYSPPFPNGADPEDFIKVRSHDFH